jgi:hypothetical protein
MNMKKDKEIKQKYDSDFERLRELVNSFDPLFLIDIGAPEDEYDSLTEKILSNVYDGKTKIEMTNLVRHEIQHHFGLVVSEEFKEKFKIELEKFIDTIYEYFVMNKDKTPDA